VLWPNVVKLKRWKVAEKSSRSADNNLASLESFEPQFCPSLGRSHPKFPERYRFSPVGVYRIWSGSAEVCQSYSRKIYFSDIKVIGIFINIFYKVFGRCRSILLNTMRTTRLCVVRSMHHRTRRSSMKDMAAWSAVETDVHVCVWSVLFPA